MTVRRPIFRKLLLSTLAPVLVALVGLEFYLTRLAANREVESVQRVNAAQARLLARELAGTSPSGLEAWAEDAGRRTRARVTVVDPQGGVLADSEHDPRAMENHAGRPEILEASRGGVGRDIRHSATLKRDLCYVAVPLVWQSKPGAVLRLAVPLDELDAAIAAVRYRIWVASLAALLAALGIAWLLARSLTRRIRRLREFGESLLSSRPAEVPAPEAADELGALASSLAGVEKRLREMVDKLSLEAARREAILASMVEGVLAVDGDLRVTFCNRSFARTVGASASVPENLPLADLVSDRGLREMFIRVREGGAGVKERLLLSDGGRTFEVRVSPLEAGVRRGVIAILHDITDIERWERVRKDFVANVSHELRTPLASIQGYAETLLDGALEDTQHNRKFLEIIRSQAVRLNNIASDLLTLSGLESDTPAPASERISIRETLESALHAVESLARLRQVSLKLDELEEAGVLGQRLSLEQVFVNLLDNAVKFNRDGGEVRIQVRRAPEGRVRISVADTGIGIPAVDLPRIFERFYRVDKARSRALGGTGLGLSIVRHAVERMGGVVGVTSRAGEGSVFTVEFPLAD